MFIHRVGRGPDEEQGDDALLLLPVMFYLNGRYFFDRFSLVGVQKSDRLNIEDFDR